MDAVAWTLDFDGWIIAIAVTCALACMLRGCFLVLRRMSLQTVADAVGDLPQAGLSQGLVEEL